MLDMPPACLRSPPWGDDEASTELRINCGEHRCSSSGTCYQPTSCGGAGERACCISDGGSACESGLIETAGCTGASCLCGGANTTIDFSSGTCVAPACGGSGQRACCSSAEASNDGGACDAGLNEAAGCSGNCACETGGNSSGTCRQATACGGAGERACCISDGGSGCESGLVEKTGCIGASCLCGGVNTTGTLSDGRCVAPECSGLGQRACCFGAEALVNDGPCDSGLNEQDGCSGNCACETGGNSGSSCYQATDCGGDGERGCCIGAERSVKGIDGPCEDDLVEDNTGGCEGDCDCLGGAGVSSGTCKATSDCGGEGERACCQILGEGDACDTDLLQDEGCTGDCLCGGDTATGQDSVDTCRAVVCGAEGQRGCCLGAERDITGLTGPCAEGLVEDTVDGCTGDDCTCLGGPGESWGLCKLPIACGGEGERACCTGVGETDASTDRSCGTGLVEVAGCQGDCLCGGTTANGERSLGTCADPECGADGERGCCFGDERISIGVGTPCAARLVGVAGCAGDCNCLVGGTSVRTCYTPAPCGQVGQRACCAPALEYAAGTAAPCAEGLTEVPGCVGDCFCGKSGTDTVDDDLFGTSSGTCVRFGDIDEPATGFTPLAVEPACAIRGYADIHMHMFSDIGHGGGVLAGDPCPRQADTFCDEAFATGSLAPGECGTSYCDSTDSLTVNDALGQCFSS
jgi:hypothetical protein